MVRVGVIVGSVVFCTFLALAVMEVAARWIGLGTPVLYYTAAWGGLRPIPGQQVPRLSGATVTVDDNGFRTARAEEPDALRVLFIGDSVTWGGSYVDDAEIFSEVSADVLRAQGISVYAMNAGVNGTSLVNQMEVFRVHAASTDVLVWLFPSNDVFRAYNSGGDLFPARFPPRFALVEAIDLAIFLYWRTMLRYDLSRHEEWSEYPDNYEEFYDAEKLARKQKNTKVLSCVLGWTNILEIPVVVGITPRFENKQLVPPPSDLMNVIREAAGDNVRIFDVYETLENSGKKISDLFVDKVHFSAQGHEVVGEELGKRLTSIVEDRRWKTAGAKKAGEDPAVRSELVCY